MWTPPKKEPETRDVDSDADDYRNSRLKWSDNLAERRNIRAVDPSMSVHDPTDDTNDNGEHAVKSFGASDVNLAKGGGIHIKPSRKSKH